MPELLERLRSVTRCGDGWLAQCPAHDDARSSLSVNRGVDGRWLVKCHAGCSLDQVLRPLGLKAADVFPTDGQAPGRRIVATYDYGMFEVVRFAPKDFRQRRPDGNGGWIWNTKGLRPLVYHRQDVQGRQAVIVAEGEKDVDRLWALSLPATCNAGGAGKWKKAHTDQLVEAGVTCVTVIPDGDTPGRNHAEAVARSCVAAGLTVKVVPLPSEVKDVSAYLAAGASKTDLLHIIKTTDAYMATTTELAAADIADVPVVRTLSTVKREQIDWLWEPRFARRKLTIVAGEPGFGKSSMTLDVTARITKGTTWPDGSPAPQGDVLLLSAEDGRAADSSRVHALTAIKQIDGTERGFDLSRDLPALEVALRRTTPVLMIIDPLSAYLGKTDSWRASEVRGVLTPLVMLAEHYNCAVVGVLHLTKNSAQKALNRVMGSVAFVGQARIVQTVAADPDDEARRLLIHVKNNLAPPPPTLAFRFDGSRVAWEDGPVEGVTADSVLGELPADQVERKDTEAFLRELLADGEPMPQRDVVRAARANGISERTLKRVKAKLNVKSKLVGFGREGQWRWWLPVSETRHQTGPESAIETVAPSGPLCDSREGQESATSNVAPSIETLKKHTESAEGANPEVGDDDAGELANFLTPRWSCSNRVCRSRRTPYGSCGPSRTAASRSRWLVPSSSSVPAGTSRAPTMRPSGHIRPS